MVCGPKYRLQFCRITLTVKVTLNFRKVEALTVIYQTCLSCQQTTRSHSACERQHFHLEMGKPRKFIAPHSVPQHNILHGAVLKCVFMNRSVNTSDLLPARACHGYYFRFTALQHESCSIDCSPSGTHLT